jgi:hypothetical protein
MLLQLPLPVSLIQYIRVSPDLLYSRILMNDQMMLGYRDIKQDILKDTSCRRRLRSFNGQIQTQHLMRRFMRGDWLVDEHMFDRLVVTQVDGKGGKEAEHLTRMPTIA